MPTDDSNNPEDNKPGDFIFADIPKTKKERFARTAEARVTETVKSALQSYLKRYLDTSGVHREQLQLTAPYTVHYETRLSGPRDHEDPTIYEVQLARFWGELRQRLPAILIVDTGFQRETPGLGGITDSRHINDHLSQVELSMLATVPMELQIAAMDSTTCGDLRDALAYIFGVGTHLNKGHIIRSQRPEDKWEVRIPLNETYSGLERRNVTEDPKDSFWSTTIGLEMVFEGIAGIGFDRQVQPGNYPDGTKSIGSGTGSAGRIGTIYEIDHSLGGRDPIGFRMSDGKCVPITAAQQTLEETLDSIVVPDCINLHQDAPIRATWLPAWSYFISDNPRIALVDVETCAIIPKRPGCFTLHLMDPRTPNKPTPVKSWTVTVKLS